MGNVGSHSEGEEEEEEAAAEGGGGGGGGGGTASIVTWSNSNGNWAAAASESPPPGAMEAAFPGLASPPPASSSSSSSAASTLPPPAVLLGQARLREEAAARLREVPSAEPLLSRHHAALVRWLEERLGRGEHAIGLEQLCEAWRSAPDPRKGRPPPPGQEGTPLPLRPRSESGAKSSILRAMAQWMWKICWRFSRILVVQICKESLVT
ncbi:hypothetical protein E2320_018474 [Naja naja]|nr:hypothetical protein E2320_018474 [Naja naja]